MDEDDLNDDILEDGDLDLDDDTKTRFREAVARLKLAAATPEIHAGGVVTEPERGNIAHADGNDLLRALQRDLGRRCGGIDSLWRSRSAALLDDEVERLRDQTQRDAAELVAKDLRLTIAKKDAELAAKDDELAQLRVALERLEGVPPQ
jgi:histone H3/H4